MLSKPLKAAAIAALAVLSAGAARAAAADLAIYGQLPDVADVRVSPDGSRLAYVGAAGLNQIVSVVHTDGVGQPDVITIGDSRVRAIDWVDDGHLIIVTSRVQIVPLGAYSPAGTQDFAQGLVYDLKRKHATQLAPPSTTVGFNDILGMPTIRVVEGKPTVFFKSTTFREHRNVPTLLAMDVESSVTRLIDQGDLVARDFAIGVDGKEIAQSFYSHGQWSVMVNTRAGWRTAALPPSVEQPSLAGLSPDGSAILVSSPAKPGEMAGLKKISLTDGAWLPETAPGGAVVQDPRTGRAIAYVRSGVGGRTFDFVDPADQKVWSAILKAFPGEQVDFVSASADRKQIAVQVFGPKSGAAFMLVHMATGQAELVGDIHHDLTPDKIAETRITSYVAADGMRLPGLLTLPRGRPAKALPLVVVPHGSPEGHDTLGFDWIAQALASRGYAVLQPQFRGSSVSPAVRTAGFGEWGGKMLTDISDGVAFLASQGLVDPKRVCIMGDGYGGYAALAGVTLSHGLYRCAVSIGGYSDMERFLDWESPRLKSNASAIPFLETFLGVKSASDPKLNQISPRRLADRADAPVLLIHGEDDVAVPIEQSRMMADALTAAHKPVQFVTLKGEDHRLSRTATRQQMLEAAVGFIETHNPPDPPTAMTAAVQP